MAPSRGRSRSNTLKPLEKWSKPCRSAVFPVRLFRPSPCLRQRRRQRPKPGRRPARPRPARPNPVRRARPARLPCITAVTAAIIAPKPRQAQPIPVAPPPPDRRRRPRPRRPRRPAPICWSDPVASGGFWRSGAETRRGGPQCPRNSTVQARAEDEATGKLLWQQATLPPFRTLRCAFGGALDIRSLKQFFL